GRGIPKNCSDDEPAIARGTRLPGEGGAPVIGTSSALIGAVVLLVLILVWIRADSTSRRLPSTLDGWLPDQGDAVEVCPPEFVSQIFSGQDLAFIRGWKGPNRKSHSPRKQAPVAPFGARRLPRPTRAATLRHWQPTG